MMRCVFIPVYTMPRAANQAGHIALLVISPVTKTLEFFDSDNTPIDAVYTRGLIGRVMQWMSTFLDNPGDINKPQFVPQEWRFRDTRSKQQDPQGTDCGVYVLTQAQYIAFGYDLSQTQRQNWPANYNTSLVTTLGRRFRITADVTGYGLPAPFFSLLNPQFRLGDIQNHQYYPILDTPPVLAGRTWRMFKDHPQFGTLLTATLRNRRTCYTGCLYKTWLIKHCRRNLRFYPGYARQAGTDRSLQVFREWVELTDERRRTRDLTPKPFDRRGNKNAWPSAWIDPRDATTAGQCKDLNLLAPLW